MSSKKSKKRPAPAKAAKSLPQHQPAKPALPRRGGLGRGIDALLGPNTPASTISPVRPVRAPAPAPAAPHVQPAAAKPAPAPAAGASPARPSAERAGAGSVLLVPPMDIARCPWQPRQDFNEDSLAELAESIKKNGVIQPLVARRLESGGLELIAGERRLRAAVAAGLAKVPVVLIDASDRKAAEMNLVENIQRRDLNPIEEAEGYRLLGDKISLTQQEVADQVGKSRSGVANALRLLELPDEVKQLVSQNLLSTGHAKVLLGAQGETERILLARSCVNDGLTVRALERKIARRNRPPEEKRPGKPDLPESYVRSLVDKLHAKLGCAVRLSSGVTHANGRHTKGVLEIDFFDNDDLDRVLSCMGVVPD